MKAMKYKLLICIILVLTSINLIAKEKFSKKINREFEVNKNSTFNIQNKYGKIDIYNWDENRITIEVYIWVESNSEERAKDVLELITADIYETAGNIYAITQFKEGFGMASTSLFENVNYYIDYTVKMPDYLNLNLENRYGNTFISKIAGQITIDVKYGNLNINEMLRGNIQPLNYINLSYGNANIEECKWLKTDIKYSNMDISESHALILNSSYSKISLGINSSLVTNSRYDKYKIDELKNLVVEAEYGNFNVSKLSGKFELLSKYTPVKIDYVSANFEEISIDSKYGNINMGIDFEASYQIDAEAKYGKIEYPSRANVSRIVDNQYVMIEGVIGENQQTKSKIYIRTKYGNVSLLD